MQRPRRTAGRHSTRPLPDGCPPSRASHGPPPSIPVRVAGRPARLRRLSFMGDPADLPRHHVIREGDLRILNPLSPEKLATLGRVVKLTPGRTMVDFCCGKGEMLCTWT